MAKVDVEQQRCEETRQKESSHNYEEIAKLSDRLARAKTSLDQCNVNVRRESKRSSAELLGLFDNGVQLLEHKYSGVFNVTAARESEADVASFNVSVTLRLLPRDGDNSQTW